MKAIDIVQKAAGWLPLAWRLAEAFGGNKRAAARKIREWELEQRRARDERMRRRAGR